MLDSSAIGEVRVIGLRPGLDPRLRVLKPGLNLAERIVHYAVAALRYRSAHTPTGIGQHPQWTWIVQQPARTSRKARQIRGAVVDTSAIPAIRLYRWAPNPLTELIPLRGMRVSNQWV